MYDREKEEKEKNGKIVGIDVGIKSTITISNGEVLTLDKERIMSLVRKAEKLQSIIDRKKAINKKRAIKYSRRVRELERKVHKYLQYISLSNFFRILEWKAELYRREIIRVNAKDTSKTCSQCGYVNYELRLSDKVYKCPVCGLRIDRDLNASINILKRGVDKISSGHGEYMREMAISG